MLRDLLAVLLILLAACATASASTPAGARALESRLYAPCCYGGTLDMHDSDLAQTLRREIETRLGAGEAAEAIQADFVVRYGDKVIAAKSESASRNLGMGVVVALLAAAGALGLAMKRWLKREPKPDAPGDPDAPAPASDLDARINDELEAFEG